MQLPTEVGKRFDLFKKNHDTTRSWLMRVVAHDDHQYVYLHVRQNEPVDVRVSKSTGKVYQWIYNMWETSEYQNYDVSRTDDTAFLYWTGEDGS